MTTAAAVAVPNHDASWAGTFDAELGCCKFRVVDVHLGTSCLHEVDDFLKLIRVFKCPECRFRIIPLVNAIVDFQSGC
jgi:hypothetical protein